MAGDKPGIPPLVTAPLPRAKRNHPTQTKLEKQLRQVRRKEAKKLAKDIDKITSSKV